MDNFIKATENPTPVNNSKEKEEDRYNDIYKCLESMIKAEQYKYLDAEGYAQTLKLQLQVALNDNQITQEQYEVLSNIIKELSLFRASRNIKTIKNILTFFLILSIVSIVVGIIIALA